MKKNSKIIIGVLVVLVIYALIMIIIFSNKKASVGAYLIIDKYNLSYNNGKITEIPHKNIEKLNTKFNVYINNKKLGSYYLKYGDRWNLFNDNSEFINYDGTLVASTNKLNLKVLDYSSRNLNDGDKTFITKNYKINNFNDLWNDEIISIDFDNNDVEDSIISLSKIDDLDVSKSYNVVSVIYNNKLINIINEKGSKINKVYKIKSVLNIDNRLYLAIESIEGFDSDNPIINTDLYLYTNNKFSKIISK